MRIYRFYLILFFLFFGYNIQSQSNIEKYEIGEITVSGNTSFSPLTIITYSGLEKGETISVPGEKLSNAIKKLWASNLFSSVNVYKKNISDNRIDLEIELFDLAELKELEVNGIKKRKIEEVIKENKLQIGVKVTENLITTTKNYLENKYKEKGFLKAKVNILTEEYTDSLGKAKVNMKINIEKGPKIKINKINILGNEKLSSRVIEKSMKNTKEKNSIGSSKDQNTSQKTLRKIFRVSLTNTKKEVIVMPE